jgi:hypothetical protein
MFDTTRTALVTAAVARATKLCDAALKTLAEGRKTFVKGKPTMAPWGAEKRAQLRALQLGAFEAPARMATQADVAEMLRPLIGAEGVTAEAEEAFFAEATAVYCAAGVAEVERRFAEGAT